MKTVLITGGTGSFGKAFVRRILQTDVQKVIVFSRDELKQFEMQKEFENEHRLRFFLGDVRDRDRLLRAFVGVDTVVHAAALKQVPAAEYNPLECIKTNVLGAANVIDAAIDRGVVKVVALSTDKAVSPINLYGATKLCADKLFIAANNYSGGHATQFNVVRYGNVVGSRGSVVPYFKQLIAEGKPLTITDTRMTRFWITLDRAVDLVLAAIDSSEFGCTFVPKIPSMSVVDLADALQPGAEYQVTGIRPGEKIHESLIAPHEVAHATDCGGYYMIGRGAGSNELPDSGYTSDSNTEWMTAEDLELSLL